MGKILVQLCLKSGRGLRRSPAFWKLQWYAVGWIDPAAKYCTGIVASANGNPVWNTGISLAVAAPSDQLSLQVEVYSREPVFLRERLLGSVTVELKEFLNRLVQSGEAVEEVGSFQLRKKESGKPVGFVDVSIRVWEDDDDPGLSCIGGDEGFHLGDPGSNGGGIELPGQGAHNTTPFRPNCYPHVGGGSSYPPPPPPAPRPAGNVGFLPNFVSATANCGLPPSNHISMPPPPPPPPAGNVGFVPNFVPVTANYGLPPSSYISMPPAGRGAAPGYGFRAGAAAGAVAGGAVLYGDEFLSIPSVALDGGFSVTASLPL